MNRTGWAAAVGSLYRTRAGLTLTIVLYKVRLKTTHVAEEIVAETSTGLGCVFDGSGKCIIAPNGPDTLSDFDLIEAVAPAQITKRVECKNDLATRPQEGTVPATVVPRKDLP